MPRKNPPRLRVVSCICEHCGQAFQAPRGTRFCSETCRATEERSAAPPPTPEAQVRVVDPNMRSDRILPSRLAMVSGDAASRDGSRRSGRLFSLARHIVKSSKGQLVLPGFSVPGVEGPCLPLELYDLGVGRSQLRVRAAPLALRIWIEACLEVPMDHRGGRVRLPVPFREFLGKLWPHDLPRPAERYKQLERADAALSSMDARIPWEGPDGKGGKWRVVNIINLPRGPDALDDVLVVDVELPPGSGSGPIVSPNLHLYGNSAVAYRALLNLSYRWFDPGVTRRPVGKSRKHWTQSKRPEDYPAMTDREVLAICYPAAGVLGPGRRMYVLRGKRVLERLAQAGELRIERGHILPPSTGVV